MTVTANAGSVTLLCKRSLEGSKDDDSIHTMFMETSTEKQGEMNVNFPGFSFPLPMRILNIVGTIPVTLVPGSLRQKTPEFSVSLGCIQDVVSKIW